jgi:hypothetical protein
VDKVEDGWSGAGQICFEKMLILIGKMSWKARKSQKKLKKARRYRRRWLE